MIDLSHLNEQGFWDVARLSTAPLVATHSCAHALCPTTRNLTDRQLDAIKESDGMVGVNLGAGFLREDGQSDPDYEPHALRPLGRVLRWALRHERVALRDEDAVAVLAVHDDVAADLEEIRDAAVVHDGNRRSRGAADVGHAEMQAAA